MKYIAFLAALQDVGLQVEQEVTFAKEYGRNWRIDYLIGNVAIEIEGGVFIQGRHSRGVGLTNDAQKYNCLTLLGYKLLRFTGSQAKNSPVWCAKFVKAAIDGDIDTELFKPLKKY